MTFGKTIAGLLQPNNRRSGAQRRGHGDRRHDDDAEFGARERRDAERRHSTERRRLRHGVQYSTARSMMTFEDWLDENCEGAWRIVLDDLDTDLGNKTFTVMFEFEADKERFKSMARRS